MILINYSNYDNRGSEKIYKRINKYYIWTYLFKNNFIRRIDWKNTIRWCKCNIVFSKM